MIPNVFVSSTIQDFQHLRDAVRDTIIELGYTPVMSEHGEVGYLPTTSAEDSCYISMRECQLAILIVGKRYGEKSANGRSITYNEFITAKEQKVPVVTLVDKDVLTFKRVFDANRENKDSQIFPGMDHPADTFKFIQEIMEAPYNNGVLPFQSASEVRGLLKKQIANLFGELLKIKFDPVKDALTEALSELKTLRHELVKENRGEVSVYLKAMNFLLGDHEGIEEYRFLIKEIAEDTDIVNIVPHLLKSNSIEEFASITGCQLIIKRLTNTDVVKLFEEHKIIYGSSFSVKGYTNTHIFRLIDDNILIVSEEAYKVMQDIHEKLLHISGVKNA